MSYCFTIFDFYHYQLFILQLTINLRTLVIIHLFYLYFLIYVLRSVPPSYCIEINGCALSINTVFNFSCVAASLTTQVWPRKVFMGNLPCAPMEPNFCSVPSIVFNQKTKKRKVTKFNHIIFLHQKQQVQECHFYNIYHVAYINLHVKFM